MMNSKKDFENITVTYKFNLFVWLRFQLASLLERSKPLNIISTFEIEVTDDPTRSTPPALDAGGHLRKEESEDRCMKLSKINSISKGCE
jgi:hypothetical protein